MEHIKIQEPAQKKRKILVEKCSLKLWTRKNAQKRSVPFQTQLVPGRSKDKQDGGGVHGRLEDPWLGSQEEDT